MARAQLFEDIAGQHVKAAEAQGRTLDWWETTETLLSELRELDWGDG